MPTFPSSKAIVPDGTDPLVRAALLGVERVSRFERTGRLESLDHYYRGTQYDAREYGWDGRFLASPGGLPVEPWYPDWIVPLDQRRPPANYLVGRVIVERFTSLLFGDGRFPDVTLAGDPITEDFMRATCDAARLPECMIHARNLGGAQGTAIVSYAWVDGLPRVEVHAARHVLVLRWADPQQHIPHHVLKIWPTSEPGLDSDGQIIESDGWMAREWRGPALGAPGAERVLRYHPETHGRAAWWEVVAEAPLTECPVVWIRNEATDERHDGEGDFEGSEDMIDELNVILCATSTGTALNADPTLVVKCDPKLNPGKTKKGAFNTIYSPGGAEYLELTGSAVKAGIENVERLRAYLFEQTGMTVLDPEKMSGAAQSGEALRRLMQPTLAKADRRRETYGAGIVALLQGLWRLARAIVASPPIALRTLDASGAPVLGPGGEPVYEWRKPSLRLPPRHERATDTNDKGEVTTTTEKVTERAPGAGGTIVLKWPEYFPPTEQDKLAKITTIQAANGGHPVLSPVHAVEAAASVFGVTTHADEELAEILEGTRLFADANAGALGQRAPDAPGGTAA